MMSSVITTKKIPINLQVITFLSIVASGIDKPMTAIIKAMDRNRPDFMYYFDQ